MSAAKTARYDHHYDYEVEYSAQPNLMGEDYLVLVSSPTTNGTFLVVADKLDELTANEMVTFLSNAKRHLVSYDEEYGWLDYAGA